MFVLNPDTKYDAKLRNSNLSPTLTLNSSMAFFSPLGVLFNQMLPISLYERPSLSVTPRADMHPCLQINEILAKNFELMRELETTEHPKFPTWPAKGSKILAALARTCKVFSEPSLDLLWEFQPSLAPLIKCLPNDALAIGPHNNTGLVTIGDELVSETNSLFSATQ